MTNEVILNISTGSGTNMLETKRLKGELDVLIVDSDSKIELIIESKLGYKIFHSHEIKPGVEYIPIRVAGVDNNHHQANTSFNKYYLNENLLITVIGAKDENVQLTLRFT